MHLLIPFAAPLSEAGRAAAASLQWPHLQALLPRLKVVRRDEADAWSLTPPHERALGQALGWTAVDGLWPWAVRWAGEDGLSVALEVDNGSGSLAPRDAAPGWGLVTPCHWHLGTDQVSMVDPAQLMLDPAQSRALFNAVQELFTSEGFAMRYGAPLRWYLVHPSLAQLPSASLDRVIGRNVDRFLSSTAGPLRRLQSEVQMLLHNHPINDAREEQGLLPVNSFWLNGCGVAQATTPATRLAGPQVDLRLRGPALADDWAAWVKAWETLDEGPVAALGRAVQAGQAVQLTLCGERAALTLASAAPSWTQRLRDLWAHPPVWPLLETL